MRLANSRFDVQMKIFFFVVGMINGYLGIINIPYEFPNQLLIYVACLITLETQYP